ncbi:MAG: glycosyltransferase family 4 protein [Clostridium sp.]|nr:glycosyltransferase family 4 protein [Clostridium sp.]
MHNTFPLISPSVYYAAFSCKVPVVQTIHNFRMLCPGATFTRNNSICEDCAKKGLGQALKHKCYRNSFSQTLAAVIILKFHRILGTYNKINGYIALTNFNKNKIKKLVKDDKKIFVKPNFSMGKINRSSSEKYKDYFVYIGRLDKLKGINLLINSWRSISNDELYIIGDGPEKDYAAKLVKDNNISNIKLLGFMERNEALNIVEQSKAIIVPSQWYEGFPMTIVEAYSMGVPVIGGNIGNLNSIIKDEFNGLIFKYDDSKELVKAVKKLETNEDLILNLRKGAFKTYKDNYTEDKNYDLLYGIYNNLI